MRLGQIKLDSTDAKILDILQKDSSVSFVNIAKMLRMTEGTVRNRIKRLKDAGIIRKFTISVDARATGQTLVSFVILNAVPGRIPEVAKKLSYLDEVVELHETHTYGDLLLKVRAKSPEALADILSTKIKIVGGVIGTQVVPALKTWKDSM